MRIRAYRDSDAETVANLFTASIHSMARDHYCSKQRAAWAPQPPDIDEWRARLNALYTFIAEDGCEMAGFLSYEMNGHIDLLYTSPLYARRGVASALYREVEARLLASGVKDLSAEASLVARPFFEQQGFFVIEEQLVSRRGIDFRRYAMRKEFSFAQLLP